MLERAEAKTRRLECRRPPADGASFYRELFTEPEVERWLRPPPMKKFEASDLDRMLARDRSHWQKHGFGPWFLRDIESGEFVGRAGLNWTVVEGEEMVELPWAVRPEFQGKGIATEAARAAIGTARRLGIERIVSLALVENEASRRVMEKAGLEYIRNVQHAGLSHAYYVLDLDVRT